MKNPNGFGTVSKLSGNRRKPWVVRVTVEITQDNGKQIQKSIGTFKTRQEALRKLDQYRVAKVNNQKFKNDDCMKLAMKAEETHTFGDCASVIMEKGKNEHSDAWYRGRKSACNILKSIMNKNIQDISTLEIQSILDENSWRSESALSVCKILCTSVFRYAVLNNWISKNQDLSKYIKIKSTREAEPIHKSFTQKEVQTLMKQKDFMSKIVLVYIFTGCRAIELLADVDRYENYIVCGVKSDAGKRRKIPIHSTIAPYIDDVIDYLSVKSYDKISTEFTEYLESLGMSHLMHDTRHTFATRAKECYLVPTAVQKIMGHKVKNITDDVYTHESIEYLSKEMEKIYF